MKQELPKMKVALVCDWLTEVGGAEQVLLAVHEMFTDAPIYTSQFRPKRAVWFRGVDVRTGWLNVVPSKLRRLVPFLRNAYFGRLDLSDYDLVISIANAEAKGIKTGANTVHIAYLQGPPTQYYWGLYDQYIENPGFGKLNFLARLGLKTLVKPLRKVDYQFAQKPDFLLANSTYVQQEIKKYYGRDSTVVHPPVDVAAIKKVVQKTTNVQREGFIVAGRQVSWKRIDLAIAACIELDEKLLVVGDGPEHAKLVELARGHDNIKFLPKYDGPREIAKHLRSVRAFIFPSLEPFGITPIEALAAGTPVIAFHAGGALDFVKDGQNGVFFDEQTAESLATAIKKFRKVKFNGKAVARSAEPFSTANFGQNLRTVITQHQRKAGK